VRFSFIRIKGDIYFKIGTITLLIILLGALALYFADQYYHQKGVKGLFDALYWAIVTITTVGYGDIVPTSAMAKVAGLIIILSGPALLSLITASVASALVDRKIKEGKGLETITDKDHIIICGWNENGEKVIEGILEQSKDKNVVIVLVNELDRDDVQTIQYKYKDNNLRFARGNFVKEDVLARANIHRARAAVVMADISGGHSIERADQRTIFGTMAIKSMASKVRTCAELINADNREHLVRANVDEVYVRGGSAGSMLAKAAVSPGVIDAILMLIRDQDENKLWRIPVPSKFIQKPLEDMRNQLTEKHQAIVLAVLGQEKGITLDDILSEDSTSIDEFIRRKFEESGKDFFGGKKNVSVHINPPDDFELSATDWLLVISKERP
jgi:voltage-gated potassium channel